MKKINKIFILFIFLVTGLALVFWQIIQSGPFAHFLSARINQIFQRQLQVKVSFQKIHFKFFPPGAILNEVKIRKVFSSEDIEEVELVLRKVETDFHLFDMMVNKVSIKRIELQDGLVFLRRKEKEETEPPPDEKGALLLPFKKGEKLLQQSHAAIWSLLDQFRNEVPISLHQVELRKIRFISGNIQGGIDGLELQIKKDSVDFKLAAHDIRFSPDPKLTLDGLDISLSLTREQWIFHQLHFFQRLNHLSMAFALRKLQNRQDQEYWAVEGGLGVKGDLEEWVAPFKDLEFIRELKVQNGVLLAQGRIRGRVEDPTIALAGTIHRPQFGTFFLDGISFDLIKRREMVICQKGELSSGPSKLSVSKPFPIFNLQTETLFPDKPIFRLTDIHSDKLFYFLGETLEPLKGVFNGEAQFSLEGEKIEITVLPGFSLSQASLLSRGDLNKLKARPGLAPEGITPVLKLDKVVLNSGNLKINVDDFRLELGLDLSLGHTRIQAAGKMDKKKLAFHAGNPLANLKDLGPISGVPLKGKGPVALTFEGPLDHVVMKADLDLEESEVLDFRTGKIKTSLEFDLEKAVLTFHEFRGQSGETDYSLDGQLDFEDKEGLSLESRFTQATYRDFLQIFGRLYTPPNVGPDEVKGFFTAEFNVQGGFKPKDMIIRGKFDSSVLVFKGEPLEKIKTEVLYKNSELQLKNIFMEKGNGRIEGEFHYDFLRELFSYQSQFKNIDLSSISAYRNLGLDFQGSLAGSSKGEGRFKNPRTETTMTLKNSTLSGTRVKNSQLALGVNGDLMNVSTNLAGGILELEAQINRSPEVPRDQKSSKVKAKFRADDMPLLAGLLSSHNKVDPSLKGSFAGTVTAAFNYHQWETLDLDLVLDEFYVLRKKINMDLVNQHGTGTIRDGKIKHWEFWADGEGGTLKSFASGNIKDNISLQIFLNLDASILEMMSPDIAGSSGLMENKIIFSGNKNAMKVNLTSRSDNFSLNHQKLPGVLENAKYQVTINDGKLVVEEFTGKFSQGSMQMNGEILLGGPHPRIKLLASLKGSNLSLFKKSNLLVEGKGFLEGSGPPYTLSGDFTIVKGSILDEIEDFNKGEKSGAADVRFLPKVQKESKEGPIALNVNFEIMDSLLVKNALMEMRFGGEGRLKGNINSPKLEGNFNLVPGSGKLYFKSYDFLLTKGSLSFQANEGKVNPEIYLIGNTKISDYEVTLNVLGKSDDFLVELSSDPPLSQEDILSLLTLGFTGEVSKDLNATERQNLTSVGIGSILFNRFKLTEGLKSSLGLRVSLTPEVTEQEGSFLPGKGTNTAGPISSRFNSATKVQIQKKLTNKMDLSVSSTLGGSIGQKQEMNLNYNLNDRASLEGVYEVKTGDIEEQSSESVGADLKLNWTFK